MCISTVFCKFPTLIKNKIKFSSYIGKFRVEQLQSHIYVRKGFLIYEEMRKYFPIYEEAVSYIWLCNCSIPNFLIYEEDLIFFFISVLVRPLKRTVTVLNSSVLGWPPEICWPYSSPCKWNSQGPAVPWVKSVTLALPFRYACITLALCLRYACVMLALRLLSLSRGQSLFWPPVSSPGTHSSVGPIAHLANGAAEALLSLEGDGEPLQRTVTVLTSIVFAWPLSFASIDMLAL